GGGVEAVGAVGGPERLDAAAAYGQHVRLDARSVAVAGSRDGSPVCETGARANGVVRFARTGRHDGRYREEGAEART
ncbi:MAG: hypothetical protein K6T68_13835, partial [Alicyclobacillus shizuokensis]|nr:hypothetical protein [Alicyclobacillus shizuokensis]